MEGFITLFNNTPAEGKRPHYKGYLKIDGVEHEFALWPAKDGKAYFYGKYQPTKGKKEAPPTSRDAEELEF